MYNNIILCLRVVVSSFYCRRSIECKLIGTPISSRLDIMSHVWFNNY